MTISNPNLLFISKTAVTPGIRNQKSTYQNELNVRKPLVGSNLPICGELRFYNLV
jgi:hypothetical protein